MQEDAIETQGADAQPTQEDATGYKGYQPSTEAIQLYELNFTINWPYPLEVEY